MATIDSDRIFCKYCKEEIFTKEERLHQAHNVCLQAVGKYATRDKNIKKQLEEIFPNYFHFESQHQDIYDSNDPHNVVKYESDDEGNVLSLKLHNCEIEEVPYSIGLLKSLHSLKIIYDFEDYDQGFREFIGLKIKTLPDSIGDLQNLTFLEAELSDLEELPETIGLCSNLKLLDIRYNKIKRLPNSLINCKKLEKLLVKSNELDDEFKTLRKGLIKNGCKISDY